MAGGESSVPSPPKRTIDLAPCLVFVSLSRSWAAAGLAVASKVRAKVGELGLRVGPVPAGDRLAELAEDARGLRADDMQADSAVLEVVSPLDSPRRRLDRLAPEPLRYGLIGADGDQFRLRGRLGRVVERLGPGRVDVEDRSHGHPVNLSRLERDPVTLGRGRDEWLGQARPVAEEGVVHVGPFQLRVLPPVSPGNLRFDLFHDVAIGGFGLARAEHLGDEEVCQSAARVAHLAYVWGDQTTRAT